MFADCGRFLRHNRQIKNKIIVKKRVIILKKSKNIVKLPVFCFFNISFFTLSRCLPLRKST